MQVVLKQESFVERRDARELYIDRVDVLDKVKQLVMLPDGKHITTRTLAEFYEVDMKTIEKYTERHRDELISDGYKVLTKIDLRVYKEQMNRQGVGLSARSHLALWTRRAILRIGMLLRDSEVAKQVRTYLLNVEQNAATGQRKGTLTYTGVWTQEQIDHLLETVITVVRNDNGTAKQAFEKVAKVMGVPNTTVANKWATTVKKIAPEDVLEKIRNNRRGTALQLVDNSDTPNKEEINSNHNDTLLFEQLKEMKKSIEVIQEQQQTKETGWAIKCAGLESKLSAMEEIITVKNELHKSDQREKELLNTLLAEKNEKIKQLKISNRSLQETANILMNRMSANGGNESVQFKMERNGNLEKQ